jgi:hypothetical protein
MAIAIAIDLISPLSLTLTPRFTQTPIAMLVTRLAPKRHYRAIVAALISGGSSIALLPALADQNSPAPGILIENQATGTFTDTTDNSIGTVLSDKVTVTVAEVAGISATGSAITNPAYRTNVVYFDFLVKNEGNDPTQFFVPAAPSVATVGGVAIPAANIGQLQVIEYNNATTTSLVATNNLVDPTTGSATGNLTGVPNGGSVPAGGYIKVRVPITVPANATTGNLISITLGNTSGQLSNTNTPYRLGANGTGANDLYTQDNPGTTNGDVTGDPINGDTTTHRQEASATQTTPVVAPSNINISGTVWDDANGTGSATFTTIQDGAEQGADTINSNPDLYAILVNSAGRILATTLVDPQNGTYRFSTSGGQNGLYIMLSTSDGLVGSLAPAPSVPDGWVGTTPLTYAGVNAFNVGIVDVTNKDFGIELLPDTTDITQSGIANPPGVTTKYQVPTLAGIDTEDDTIGAGNTFRIVTIPNPAQGILYYNNTPVNSGQVISNYNPTLLKFDPVDGLISMSFTYAAIDAAGKEDPTPGTITMGFNASPVSISGKVIHDKDASAIGFTNILTPGETGTDGNFGTTTTRVNAILVNLTTGLVINTKVVNPNGTYYFASVPSNTNVKIILAPTSGTIGALPPTAAVPPGWVSTSPLDSGPFSSGVVPITGKDFGIRQKAKFVLLKRITKINGKTTNPNDGTVLNAATTDDFNIGVSNWPTNYLFGQENAGKIKPNDTIEYTVYFLNNQGTDATAVKICDPIRGGQDYVPNTIQLQLGTGAITPQNDSADATDYAHSYSAGNTPSGCNAAAATSTGADNGGIAIGIPNVDASLPAILGATGIGTPTQSYGLFRFTTKLRQ